MIYPFPYSKGVKGSIIIGNSSTYNITSDTVDSDIEDGYAKKINHWPAPGSVGLDTISLEFASEVSGPAFESYSYVLIPNDYPEHPSYNYLEEHIGYDPNNTNYEVLIPWYSNQSYGALYNWYAAYAATPGGGGYWIIDPELPLSDTYYFMTPASSDWNNMYSDVASDFKDFFIKCAGKRGVQLGEDDTTSIKVGLYDHPRWIQKDPSEDSLNLSIYGNGIRNGSTGAFSRSAFPLAVHQPFIWLGDADVSDYPYYVFGHAFTGTGGHLYYSATNSDITKTYGMNVIACRGLQESEVELDDGTILNDVSDYDGNIYGTVKIHDKVWTRQPMATTRYAGTGISIEKIHRSADWISTIRPGMSFEFYNFNVPNRSWWVKEENFLYESNYYTLYKIKRVGLGSPQASIPVDLYFSNGDLGDGYSSTKPPTIEIPIVTPPTPEES